MNSDRYVFVVHSKQHGTIAITEGHEGALNIKRDIDKNPNWVENPDDIWVSKIYLGSILQVDNPVVYRVDK